MGNVLVVIDQNPITIVVNQTPRPVITIGPRPQPLIQIERKESTIALSYKGVKGDPGPAGAGGSLAILEFTPGAGFTQFIPSGAQLAELNGRVPVFGFRNQSFMKIISAGVPDSNQIKVPNSWTPITWNLDSTAEDTFYIVYK